MVYIFYVIINFFAISFSLRTVEIISTVRRELYQLDYPSYFQIHVMIFAAYERWGSIETNKII